MRQSAADKDMNMEAEESMALRTFTGQQPVKTRQAEKS
jgi:hypothetical protein